MATRIKRQGAVKGSIVKKATGKPVNARAGMVTDHPRLTGPRKLILDVVSGMGGEIRDADGGATAIVHERLERAGHVITAKSLANALKAMEDRGMLEREVRGKRTYAIRVPGVAGRDASRSPEVDRQPVHPDGGHGLPGAHGDLAVLPTVTDIDRLATALLEHVALVLAREAEAADDPTTTEIKHRLAVAIDESQRAVKRLRDVESKYELTRDELAAVKGQERVWKSRLEQAETNIQAIVKAGGRPLNDREYRALERFIAQTPNAKR